MDWIDEFRADGEARLARLARDIDASGEAAAAALDFSRDSLILVWSWLLPRLTLRRPADELDAAAQPPWWHRRDHYQPSYWDDATIDRVGAVAYYAGETLVRRDADASWAYSDRKDDSEAGEALIHFADSCSWWNPLVLVLNLLRAARDGESSRTALADACDPAPARPSGLRPRGGRLKLRLRPAPRGLLRQRRPLAADTVAYRLSEHLAQAVQLPGTGMWTHQRDVGDPPECQIDYDVTLTRRGVHEIAVLVGGAPEDPGSERDALRDLLATLVRLAEETGSLLKAEAVGAVDEEWAMPEVLTAKTIEFVLGKIGATPSERRAARRR